MRGKKGVFGLVLVFNKEDIMNNIVSHVYFLSIFSQIKIIVHQHVLRERNWGR